MQATVVIVNCNQIFVSTKFHGSYNFVIGVFKCRVIVKFIVSGMR